MRGRRCRGRQSEVACSIPEKNCHRARCPIRRREIRICIAIKVADADAPCSISRNDVGYGGESTSTVSEPDRDRSGDQVRSREIRLTVTIEIADRDS